MTIEVSEPGFGMVRPGSVKGHRYKNCRFERSGD